MMNTDDVKDRERRDIDIRYDTLLSVLLRIFSYVSDIEIDSSKTWLDNNSFHPSRGKNIFRPLHLFLDWRSDVLNNMLLSSWKTWSLKSINIDEDSPPI